MKRLSTALAATVLLALAGCGSRTANTSANNSALDGGNDVYDVAPDSMGANDMGNASLSGGNSSSSGNTSSSSNASSGSSNSSGSANSSASHAGNSH